MFFKNKTKDNVISMKPNPDTPQAVALRLVDTYWHGLRHDHPIPARSQIDPRGLDGALDVAFVAERIGKGLARLRVAGTHLSDLMGMEVAGMPLSALFVPDSRDTLASVLEKLFTSPAIIRVDLRSETGPGRPALTGELVIYPLRSDMDDVNRALGVLVTRGAFGRVPCRMEIVGVRVEPLTSSVQRIDIRPDRTPAAREDALVLPRQDATATPLPSAPKVMAEGFAEQNSPFEPKPKLRLVKTDCD